MESRADENSRALGGLLCLGVLFAAALFVYGLAVQSYWALALPVAAGLLFVLGLVFWVGWTIATVRIEATGEPLPSSGAPGAATTTASDSDAGSASKPR